MDLENLLNEFGIKPLNIKKSKKTKKTKQFLDELYDENFKKTYFKKINVDA